MARTTLDIDTTVLEQLKARARCERKTMGELASELLARALGAPTASRPPRPGFWWPSTSGGALVDIDDRDALITLLDREQMGIGE